jgi:molecular chaperone DnaK (HSP70)/HEAT repeat protein
MPVYLSIDFGTTNSVIAIWNEQLGIAEPIHIPGASQSDPPPLIPSLLYVENGQTGEMLFGQLVKDSFSSLSEDRRLFQNFKRGILTSDEKTTRMIDGAKWNDQDAGKYFLRALLNKLPFPPTDIEQLVLGVPITAFSHYVNWLTEATQDLRVEQVRVVDESTAAALGYAVTEPSALVFVLDFGGGSLDLSLVKLPESRERTGGFLGRFLSGNPARHTAKVIAKSGRVLGGSDVDRWLFTEVLRKTQIEADKLGDHAVRLLSACEKAKIQLSSLESTSISFESDQKQQTVTISRGELESLLKTHQFPQYLRQAVSKVLNSARRQGIFREDIQHVLLVGGMSIMPLVQDILAEFFPRQVLHNDKPFTAVAEGALQLAAGFSLEDHLTHSFGLRYFDIEKGITTYEEILPAGMRYPTKNPLEMLLGTAYEGQQTLELIIGEIEPAAVSSVDVQYENGEPVFIAQLDDQNQVILPINQASAANHRIHLKSFPRPGEVCVRAAFSVDSNRQIIVSITELQTGEVLLDNALLVSSQETQATDPTDSTSGFEPSLAPESLPRKGIHLSIRQLANLLSANALSPEVYSLEAAAAMLNHRDLYVRYEAARMLSRRGDRPARQIIQHALEQGTPPTRASAIRHVYGFTWYTTKSLLQKALADPEWRVREGAIYALCEFNDPRAYQLAFQALQSESEDEVFAAAAWGLRNSQDPEAVPVLETALRAQDIEIRERALESLGANNTPEAGSVVLRILATDPNPDIQYAAALSLLEIHGDDCLPALAELISKSTSNIGLALLRALFHASNYLGIHLGASRHLDVLLAALETALDDLQPEVRLSAIWPLAWMRHPRATELLLQAYQAESNRSLQTEIAYIVKSLGSPAAKYMD